MSKKSGAIAELIEQFKGRDIDAHYLGYFEVLSNRQLYFPKLTTSSKNSGSPIAPAQITRFTKD